MSDAEMSPGIAHTPDSDSFAVRVLPTHLQLLLSIVCYSAVTKYYVLPCHKNSPENDKIWNLLLGRRIEVGVMAHMSA